jgi:hypothetical protein
MQNKELTRRQIMASSPVGAAVLTATTQAYAEPKTGSAGTRAILGGEPVRAAPFPRWPNFRETDERDLLPVLRSDVWSRAKVVAEAEKQFARLMGPDIAWRPLTEPAHSSRP